MTPKKKKLPLHVSLARIEAERVAVEGHGLLNCWRMTKKTTIKTQ
jgi:hypothetical protein